MGLSDQHKRDYSKAELAVLDGVIDYAERMIREGQELDASGGLADNTHLRISSQAPLYQKLRHHAYAKTVVVETELKGRLEFRLTPTEATYINATSIGYCTPHSPVGRMAAVFHPGYEGESKLWGEYRVVEVRSFDRYSGPDFEPNVRNFLRMAVDGEEGKGSVTDLRRLFRRKRASTRKAPAPATVESPAPELHPSSASSPPVISPPPAQVLPAPRVEPAPSSPLTLLRVSEEPEAEDTEFDLDEADFGLDEIEIEPEAYYGLSERFFTHQTMEQNQIIARSPIGAMFVQGIAGSGKTSAALGRTKMLTTFNTNNVADETAFSNIAGDDHVYWARQFAGQFSEESCVGFVRTGELIQYLKETCRRIDLPNLPVIEYKELQTRLRDHRRVTHSAMAGRRWTGLVGGVQDHHTTTMAWLQAADHVVAHALGRRLVDALPSVDEIAEPFDPAVRDKVTRVISIAMTLLRERLQDVASGLQDPPRQGRFALDGLASRLLAILDEVRQSVLGPKVIWTRVGGRILFASDEQALARQLVEAKTALYLQGSQRLVFIDAQGPIDLSLQFLTHAGTPVAWNETTKALMSKFEVLVQEPSGKCFHAIPSDINHLYLRLLPESSERVFTLVGGELHRLPRARGWGRERLTLRLAEDLRRQITPDDAAHEGDSLFGRDDLPRQMTPDAVFARLVRRRLLQPLIYMADTYLTALQAFPQAMPDPVLASQVRTQMERFKLGDAEIDLVLCLGHLVGRGFRRPGAATLLEPPVYQSVFVDEVQDFTEQQVYLMVEQANPTYRAVTVAGDLAQKLHHGSSIDLDACFPGQSIPCVHLTENLRQAEKPGMALFSACFRAVLQGGQHPSGALIEQARNQGVRLAHPHFRSCKADTDIDTAILDELTQAKRYQTVAVLFPDAQAAQVAYKRIEKTLKENLIEAEVSEKVNLARRYLRHFTDVANAKGLEFDVVVLADVDGYDLSDVSSTNRLYVGVTRARQRLTLLTRRTKLTPKWSGVLKLYQNCLRNQTDSANE